MVKYLKIRKRIFKKQRNIVILCLKWSLKNHQTRCTKKKNTKAVELWKDRSPVNCYRKIWNPKTKMDSNVEETELDVGSASDELESSIGESKLPRRPTPKPFTIESLIGNCGTQKGSCEPGTQGEKTNENEEDSDRDREYLYQRHYLATAAASALPPGWFVFNIACKLSLTLNYLENFEIDFLQYSSSNHYIPFYLLFFL